MRYTKLVVLLIAALAARGEGQLVPENATPEQPPYSIAVDVNLVVLHPVVRDRSGGFVSDLTEQDFSVYEDGVLQSIRLFQHEDTPVTVGLVVDHSGSMRPKLNEVIVAASVFAQSSNPEDEMFVVNFNEHASLGLSDSNPFTNRSRELEAAISHMPAEGMTALYDAAIAGLEQLRVGARDKKVLLIVSDGGDNASAHSLTQVLEMAERSKAIIYTIGVFDEGDPDKNPKVLKRLARESGGASFFPGSLGEIVGVCESIARDVRNQYTIGYFSNNPVDGEYRSVRVVARSNGRGKLAVRNRAGYIPGSAPVPAGKQATP
jgi:VWFA-related protein